MRPIRDSAIVGFSDGSSTVDHTFQLNGSQSSGAFLDSNDATGLINNDLRQHHTGSVRLHVRKGKFAPTPSLNPRFPFYVTVGGEETGLPCQRAAQHAGRGSGNFDWAEFRPRPVSPIPPNAYSDPGCSDLVASGGAEAVSDGDVPSGSLSFSAPGTYYWQASYSGDGINQPTTSPCGSEVSTVFSGVGIETTSINDGYAGDTVLPGASCMGRNSTV